MAVVKVNWSGGKDSTAAMLLHLQNGDAVKAVCYVPMLTSDIPLIMKDHYEFIKNAAERFRSMGATVDIVSGMTYAEFVLHIVTKGTRKGHIFGFPCHLTGCCNFKNYSKEKALNSFDVGVYDYTDIGIAADEVKRQTQLSSNMRSILCELDVTEACAIKICEQNYLLSPHYAMFARDGCALCYNASEKLRRAYFEQYPEAVDVVLNLQNAVKKEMESGNISFNKTPLRNNKFFIEKKDGKIIIN